MASVEIKFSPRNRLAILEGRKSCTSRRGIKGREGDIFEIGYDVGFGTPEKFTKAFRETRQFRITTLSPMFLGNVRDAIYDLEGYESPLAFETDWKKLHRGHFNPDQMVVVHYFDEVKK